jgi:hypothetical protein
MLALPKRARKRVLSWIVVAWCSALKSSLMDGTRRAAKSATKLAHTRIASDLIDMGAVP